VAARTAANRCRNPCRASRVHDARFLLPTGSDLDYDRETIQLDTSGNQISNSEEVGKTAASQHRLQASEDHLQPYDAHCRRHLRLHGGDIALLGDAFIEKQPCSSVAKKFAYTDLGVVSLTPPASGQHFPLGLVAVDASGNTVEPFVVKD